MTTFAPLGIQLVTTLQGPGSRAVHAAWSPDGNFLAVAFADGSIRIWPPTGGPAQRVLSAPVGRVEHLAWSPDSRLLVSGRSGRILSWEAESGAQLPSIDIGSARVSALAWSSDGLSLCAALVADEGGEHFSLRRYRCADQVEEERIEDSGWDGAWVAMSSNRKYVALSLPHGELELWDTAQLKLVRRFDVPYRKPYGVALSPDQEILALSYADGTVWMWKMETGEEFQHLQAHDAPAYSLDFSPDQTLLASKSLDGTVRIRLCADWFKGARLNEHSGSFESEIAFHPTRLLLATYGDLNTTVRIWSLDPTTLGLFGGDDMVVIRFFSANPMSRPLNLEKEMRAIEDHLAFATLRDRFDFQIRPAAKPDDLIRFLTRDRTRIVHFSGHGSKDGAILMLDSSDQAVKVSAEALSSVFRLVADHVDCVILNACYAETQARAISEHIEFVVGMQTSIGDEAAIAYSKGFYQSLGNGVSIEKAHEFGKAQIKLSGMLDQAEIPVLLRRSEFRKPAPSAAPAAEEAEAAVVAQPV